MKLNLVWLYPDILNLHGDRGNVMALISIAKAMDIDLGITKVDTADQFPDIQDIDLIVMGAGQLRDMRHVVTDMKNYSARVSEFADNGGYMLVTGSTGCLLGDECQYNDEVIEGLHLTPLRSRTLHQTRQPMLPKEVYGDDIYWEMPDGTQIIGCQIQRLDFQRGKDTDPMGKLLYGYGNNGHDGTEGSRYRNVMITNTVGPLLSCNPWLGVKIFREILAARNEEIKDFDENDIPFMKYAREGFKLKKEFLKNKKKVSGMEYKGN